MAYPWLVEALICSFCYFSLIIVTVIVPSEINYAILNQMVFLYIYEEGDSHAIFL